MSELGSLFGFVTVGLLVGFIIGSLIKREGISLYNNLFWGVVSGIINGYIGLWFLPGDGVFFAFQGTWAFLFLVNVFHQHHVEDILLFPDANAAVIHELTFKNKKQ
ncbi:MAG: hypothetical protein HUJ22_06990 [Gracilimonas sp.]|uniref:hypothetical protein n=1 Tax=Gracilimonas sp. TaxID=1974203 RepID=UPI0019CDD0EC|nr:hypothetical protein [Gracilimonas sp.]MBD3616301.1 hypothetical protein [Gracilimonas sp.]